jgi:rubredoxin
MNLRYPPGTRFRDLEVFLCPVCGASKDQFRALTLEEEGKYKTGEL